MNMLKTCYAISLFLISLGVHAQKLQDSLKLVTSGVNHGDTLLRYRMDGSIKSIKIKPSFTSNKKVFTYYFFNKNQELTKSKAHYYVNHRMGSCGELFMKEKCAFHDDKLKKEKYTTSTPKKSSTYRCYFQNGQPSFANARLQKSKELIQLLQGKRISYQKMNFL